MANLKQAGAGVGIISVIVLFLTAGTSTHKAKVAEDKWDWRAGDYALQVRYQKPFYVCRHKVRDLGAEMTKEGVDFRVAIGTKSLDPHCWILYKGRILEPTQLSDSPDLYKTDKVLTYQEFLDLWAKEGWD